ncbi:hypothetical protein [Prevotella sp.]|jgi:hypothetical protein|uniref:hypothetical protein n=1 Tax=uncultured Prevotella sp. TaxID=159272 RepID=UPI00262C3FEE|nr:hypothetical protein [uncultured Prevotella sp.]
MTKKTKFILTFVAGIITGIIMLFALGYIMSMSKSEAECVDDDIVMFDKPQKTINANVFVVMQVLPNGSALAIVDGNFDNYGTTVLFLAKDGKSYYDDQRIRVPSNKCVKPIGVFRYMTQKNQEKTVPVVEFFDK